MKMRQSLVRAKWLEILDIHFGPNYGEGTGFVRVTNRYLWHILKVKPDGKDCRMLASIMRELGFVQSAVSPEPSMPAVKGWARGASQRGKKLPEHRRFDIREFRPTKRKNENEMRLQKIRERREKRLDDEGPAW
jgi:hypothetical protein